MHLMALGLFLFEIPTLAPDQLDRRAQWQHARQARVGARDTTQFTGLGEESLTLSGAVYHEIADGEVSLAQLREMADGGESFPMVDGRGLVHGSFAITGIDERWRAFFPDGTPRRIEFTIDLIRTA